jgi:CheY-like chemotaxis protein
VLNGIEAARRIRKLCPESKILFVSQESSPDVVRKTLGLGAVGYVVKSDAARELSMAVTAVLRGEIFVGARFAGEDFAETARHTACFYPGDQSLPDHVPQFLGSALKAGRAVIVLATRTHRESLLRALPVKGIDVQAAIDEGKYIALDAAELLSSMMVNGNPDSASIGKIVGDLIARAAEASSDEHSRVAIFGELADLLCQQGNQAAAFELEKAADQLVKTHSVDLLCGYSHQNLHTAMKGEVHALHDKHLSVSGF